MSLAAKYFWGKAPENQHNFAISTVFFLTLTFFVLITASWWSQLFPFSPEVFNAKSANTSGEFVDRPQTLLVWGILYYSSLAVAEVVQLVRKVKKKWRVAVKD